MILDHLGGPIAHLLYGRLGFWSAAEGFFFLSGFVVTRVAQRKENAPLWFLRRTWKIWTWHTFSVVALAFLMMTLSLWGWKGLPGWEGFSDAPLTHLAGALLLIHLPDYLDVLPLYVLLMLGAGLVFPWVLQKPTIRAWILLLASANLWLVSLFLHEACPLAQSGWFRFGIFNPLSWQFVFWAGSTTAILSAHFCQRTPTGPRRFSWRFNLTLSLISLCLFFFWGWKNGIWGWRVPNDESIWTSRTLLGPLRLLSFTTVVSWCALLVRNHPRWLTFRFPSLLGRHSLQIYSIHLIFVYMWSFRPTHLADVWSYLVPAGVLTFLAMYAHQRERAYRS